LSIQQSLGDFGAKPRTEFERRWGITRDELERRASQHGLDADAPRERECNECGNRVTVMSDGQREAGHQKGERPDESQCSQYIGGGE